MMRVGSGVARASLRAPRYYRLTCSGHSTSPHVPKLISRRLQSTSPTSTTTHYNWIRDVEPLEKYTAGGFHPITIDNKLHNRYRVVDKLGFGGYSTVWLARDELANRFVALKVGISGSNSSHEIETSRALSSPSTSNPYLGGGLIPAVFDEFDVHGPNGTHHCSITTPSRCDLREATESGLFSLDVARAVSGGLVLAVAYMHSRGYVHGDLHLSNVLLKLPSSFDDLSVEQFYEKYGKPETVLVTRCDGNPLPPNAPERAVLPLSLGIPAGKYTLSDARVLLSDFGESFSPKEGEVRLGKDCHTPLPMRPPECQLEPEAPLSYSADIWTLAVAMWDIISMKSLFSHDFATADEILSQHVDILGPMPSTWRDRWSAQEAQFFDETGRRRKPGEMLWPSLDVAYEEGMHKYRKRLGVGTLDEEEKTAFLDLMRRMLVFRPEERLTVEGVLESEWVTKWAMRDFERIGRDHEGVGGIGDA